MDLSPRVPASTECSELFFAPLGGALARTDRSAMALNTPNAEWLYFCLTQWHDPTLAEQ
jgi:hypothetical protein